MLEKRGLGHVEAILSFVIFIGFIVFAFVFFSPFQSNRTLKSTLDYAWREVYDFANIDLETYSVYITDTNAPSIVALAISGAPAGLNATVEGSSGNLVQSYTNSNGLVIFSKPADRFARIKFGPDFGAGNSIIGIVIPPQSYTVSSSETKKYFSESRLLGLNSTYNADYNVLKKQFNLPNRVNFGFSLTFSDGTKIAASKEIPKNAEVISQTDRAAVVRINGGLIEYAEMRVFVW